MKKCIIIFGIALLQGCALDSEKPARVIANFSDAAPPEMYKGQEPPKEVIKSEITEPNELTLQSALALTLDKNPELRSFSHNLRIGEARIIQAGLRPNPEISLMVEDVLGTREYSEGSRAQSTLQLSQVIELGGKRSARLGVASAVSEQFKSEYEIKRVEVLTSLTDKFIRTAADEQLLRLAEKGEDLAKQALQNIKRRAQAGGVSELEESKAKVILERSHIATEHVEHELLSAKKELSAFWGTDNPQFAKLLAELFEIHVLPNFEELLARIDRSLEIKKWANEKRLREAEQKLAEAKSVPNLLLGGGPRRIETSHNESWVFQFSMPLSIFDRNQGAREEASVLREKVEIDENASLLRLKTTLFGLYQESKHARTVIESMKKEIIPQAERSLQIAQSGYDQGRFSYLDLLDAQRTLLEVYRENIEAAYSFHSYTNSMERLLGAALNTNESK